MSRPLEMDMIVKGAQFIRNEMSTPRGKFETKTLVKIVSLSLKLDDYQKTQGRDDDFKIKTALKITDRMWLSLPEYVTQVTFEKGITIAKPSSQTDRDPLIQDLSESWTLADINDHIQYLGSQITSETGKGLLADINEKRASLQQMS